jgi:hypothetical protein
VDALGLTGHYDDLIVDEAQDLLTDEYLDVLELQLRGELKDGSWAFFYDPQQDLFQGTTPSAMHRLTETRPAMGRLTVNCRNTKAIAIQTHILTGMDSREAMRVEGLDVDQIRYSDAGDERRQVNKKLKGLLSQGVRPEAITVLSGRRRENGPFAEGFGEGVPPPADLDGSQRPPGRIAYSTLHAFKGLESDVVILTDLDDLSTPEAVTNAYVGATRARALLVLCLNRDLEPEYLRRVEDFGRRLRRSE